MPTGVVPVVETVSVEVPDVVTDVGLNVPVAPVGNPVTLKVTVPVKPPEPVTVCKKLVLLPWITDWELGEEFSEKSGGALTTKIVEALWVKLPLVPVTVSVEDPMGVLELVDTVSVEDPDPVTNAGLKDAVASEGNPLMLRLTSSLKPPELVIVEV